MTARIEAQIERFAPGFTKRIIARSTMAPRELERHNANLVGVTLTEGLRACDSFSCAPPFGSIEHLLEVSICVHHRRHPGVGSMACAAILRLVPLLLENGT